MPYITVLKPIGFHQFSLEELMFGDIDAMSKQKTPRFVATKGATKTRYVDRISDAMAQKVNHHSLITKLERFNQQYSSLFEADRWNLYTHFTVPKKSGSGERKIDAPNQELMLALRHLKAIFESDFNALYHTSAFAYIKNRCTVDAVKKHQQNESRWFLKLDFSNFFGSTTLDFVMRQFSMIFPFSEIVAYPRGKDALEKALSLCFLNGGLPQGTPISPLITNVMMIPIDYVLSNKLRNFEKNSFVYTRYADDIDISCRYDFNFHNVLKAVTDTLEEFNAPFTVKPEKTKYQSSSGRNWMLGVMLNKDNKITLGHKRKKDLRARIYNYIEDRKNSIPTPVGELMELQGVLSYFRMVEPNWTNAVIDYHNKKLNADLERWIKEDIAA